MAAQVGTLLLRTPEAGTKPAHADAPADSRFSETVVTRAFSGRPARALRNHELLKVGVALVGCAMHPDGAAVIRLVISERARFGDEFDPVRTRGRDAIVDRLAGKLAQLTTNGRLRLDDPQRAARHFLALVNDDALSRSGYGAMTLTAADVATPVADAVDTFLGAFGADDHEPEC